MPTRTINLKMVLRRDEQGLAVRRALWTTHATVNRAVANIETMLVLCRGNAYWYRNEKDEEVQRSSVEVPGEALAMARALQQANGKPDSGTDEEVLRLLRGLYENIVPSCLLDDKGKPRKGDAQAANAWVSPLMDKESKGGLSVFDKVLSKLPDWVAAMEEKEADWQKAADAWLTSEDALRLLNAAGSPAGWVRKMRENKPWHEDFVKDQAKKKQATETGASPLTCKLSELGLLPMLPPPVQSMLKSGDVCTGVSVWDRMAMRLAVAHLLSWESWNHTTRSEHTRIQERLRREQQEAIPLNALLETLRGYERERQEQLKKVSLALDDAPYHIRSRAVRAWDLVRERWLASGDTQAKRKKILSELQTKLRGRFGDPELFNWLAATGRENLWREQKALPTLVRLNELQSLLARKREYALFTSADARIHPRWVMFEKPGGSNLRNYSLAEENKELFVKLSLLGKREDGPVEEQDFTVQLAPSGQFQEPTLAISREGAKNVLRFGAFTSAHQKFSGAPGGSEILFDRLFMENRPEATLAGGEVGPVWFKLTVDVDSQAPAEWLDAKGRTATPPEVHHFKTALCNKSKHAALLSPGLRVLSVDLGLRTFAACSVFELVKGKPTSGLCWPTGEKNLWARHERSFLLPLPGEDVSAKALAVRQATGNEVFALKRDIGRLRDLLRLGEAEQAQRKDQFDALMESLQGEEDRPSALRDLLLRGGAELKTYFMDDAEPWRNACIRLHAAAEQVLAEAVHQWRKRTRPRPENWSEWHARRDYSGGKSMWMLEYLDRIRKLLKSWSLRGRQYGQINRLDRAEQGTFAAGLLRHINNLKEDRTKSGADLIIQAARGLVPMQSGWEQKYGPCRLVLFEDLARYRFRSDRSRRENSQLMKWNHREIVREAGMQAQIYGIVCDTTAAGFSSRFHAATGAPGVRCRKLDESDFEQGQPKQHIITQLGERAPIKELSKGMMVPWEGGEFFATIDGNGKALVLHADLNAAQNLQRRFWTRCGDAYRLPCMRATVNGQEAWYPESLGVRQRGAVMQLTGGTGHCRIEVGADGIRRAVGVPQREWQRALGNAADEHDIEGEDELEEALADIEVVREEGRETFFRDPSGHFFGNDQWLPGKEFWFRVRSRVWSALTASTKGESGGDDIPY